LSPPSIDQITSGALTTGLATIYFFPFKLGALTLAAIILQSNQNEQHGGQSIPNFDYAMAGWVMEIGCNYPEATI